MRNKWIALLLSTALLNSAYFWPTYFFWLIFFFLVPLFYCVKRKKNFLSFKEGFLWGALFFGIHWLAFLQIVINRGHGSWRIIAYLIFIVYMALHSGLWFLCADQLAKRISSCVGWLLATLGYFFIMDRYVFWLFGVAYGYPFGNPLMLLSVYPQTLFLLPLLTRFGLLTCAVLFSWFIANQQEGQGGKLFLCLIPFFLGFIINDSNRFVPEYLKYIAIITPPIEQKHPLDMAQNIANKIERVGQKDKEVKVFIMPESSYPFPLNQHQEIVRLWQDNCLSKETSLIIGSHKKENKKLFNSAYFISKSRIILTYDKSKPTPITEFLAFPLNKIDFLQKLFLNNKEPFTAGSRPQNFDIDGKIFLCPYICSDLFFSLTPQKKETALFLVNESWFHMRYMRRLMYYHAVFKTIEWQLDSIYVGHTNGTFIDKVGFQTPLFTV